MIFLTVGTEKYPFDRLIRTLDEAVLRGDICDEIFCQKGGSGYVPENFNTESFISFAKMVDTIKKADVVVSHAGVGTVILCLTLGKVPVIFPRRSEFYEHLDDHQLEFSEKMASNGQALVAEDEKELVEKIKFYDSLLAKLRRDTGKAKKDLMTHLRGYIDEIS